jgi:hypothetical protein
MPSRSSGSRRTLSYPPSKSLNPISKSAIIPTPVQTSVQVQQPGFFSNMWQGFGLGAGQSIAHNIFRSDPKVTHVHENVPATSSISTSELLYSKEYTQCLKDNSNDKDLCKQFM